MAAADLVFRMSGFGRIIQEVQRLKGGLDAVGRSGSRAAGAVGAGMSSAVPGRRVGSKSYPTSWTSGLGGGMAPAAPVAAARMATPEGRSTAGRWAKVGKFATNLGPLGQIAEAANGPRAGMAAIGVGAVAAGFALNQFAKVARQQVEQMERNLRTTAETRHKIAGAASAANAAALSSTLGRREELTTGPRADPRTRAFFASADKIQRQIDSANLDRAIRFGEGTMRDELTRTKAPEAVMMGELAKEAAEQTALQEKLVEQMNWFQKAVIAWDNGINGRGIRADAEVMKAIENQAAIAAGAP